MANRNFKQKRIALEHQIALAKSRVASTAAKLAKDQARLQLLEDDHTRLLASHKAVLGPHSVKNRRMYAVLDVVKARLLEPDARDGLRASDLQVAVAREGYKVNGVTFRSYLRRYNGPVLRKDSDRWRLIDETTTSAPLTQWEVASS